MDVVVFTATEIVPVLRALRDVALANGAFTAAEAELVEAVARLHGVSLRASELEPIAPEELARVVADPHRRKRVVQLATVTALVEGEPGPETSDAVLRLARALDVPDAEVEALTDLAHGHSLLTRFDMMRRIRKTLAPEGIAGLFKIAAPIVLGLEDRQLAQRYLALGECAPGTLGRALFDHYREHGFKLPGEPGGIPERGVFHDVGHVLSGYGVDPHGEIRQAAFQAGFVRDDGFVFLLFGILQFHVGMRLTPIAKAETGFFDVGDVLRAVARGAACKADLSVGFDVFAHANERLDAIRTRLGIPPLA